MHETDIILFSSLCHMIKMAYVQFHPDWISISEKSETDRQTDEENHNMDTWLWLPYMRLAASISYHTNHKDYIQI